VGAGRNRSRSFSTSKLDCSLRERSASASASAASQRHLYNTFLIVVRDGRSTGGVGDETSKGDRGSSRGPA
jgi:hypothetical protein